MYRIVIVVLIIIYYIDYDMLVYCVIVISMNNNNNKHFLICKLLTPLVDYGSKPTCPERVVNVQSTIKTRWVRLLQGRQSLWEMLD